MAIADPDILLVLNDASGTTVTNDGSDADVTIDVHSGGTAQYDWNQDSGSYDGFLDINAGSGANQTFVDCSALTYGTTLDNESLAIRFNLLSFHQVGNEYGYIIGNSGGGAEEQGQIIVVARPPTSTGDFDLYCYARTNSNFGSDTSAESTFQDLSFSTDYAVSVSADRSTSSAVQDRFKLDANTTYAPATSNQTSQALINTGLYSGRGTSFSNYYGITGRLYYIAYWRGYALTDTELGDVNSDPATNIPLWPGSGASIIPQGTNRGIMRGIGRGIS